MSEPLETRLAWSYRRIVSLTAVVVLAALLGACDIDPVISIPPLGTLVITTVTTGSNHDPDGYQVVAVGPSLDATRAIGVNGSVIFSIGTAGDYTIELFDVARNCAVATNPQVVSVAIGSTSTVIFDVACT